MTKSKFGFERPEDSPGFLLWQTTITWQRLIKKALDEYQISHGQFVIMACLLWFAEQQQAPTQAMIIELTKLDKMTVSQALKKLTAIKLVTRKEHPSDTRAKVVQLTATGKALTGKLAPIVEGIDEAFFAGLDSSEQKQLIKSLSTISN